ncbi:MAG: hypothetical protein HXX08_11525 [Chloroflexi bacterium]|uniref:Uncharacterized protein n=1 Tax=Candidatus Chlorohelix allophototropha TaxID=3003348 RepID=A0A8T7M2I7_9CHLR|nr:hypothetical protein [Chloroflexota bacterium]WJW65868.1 hypothetical protein OZ401_001647 [Chloroflexota bacterium L227-S17]
MTKIYPAGRQGVIEKLEAGWTITESVVAHRYLNKITHEAFFAGGMNTGEGKVNYHTFKSLVESGFIKPIRTQTVKGATFTCISTDYVIADRKDK